MRVFRGVSRDLRLHNVASAHGLYGREKVKVLHFAAIDVAHDSTNRPVAN